MRVLRVLATPIVVASIYGFLLRSAARDAIHMWRTRKGET